MAFNIFLPAGNGQAIDLGFAPGRNGKLDFSFGVRNFSGYGNGYYGGRQSNELGFSTRGGLYTQGDSAQYTPWGQRTEQWGQNAYGGYNNSQQADVYGNYQANRYARNVFGGYSAGQTNANGWGYTDNNVAGNVWGGGQYRSGSYGNVFGGGGGYGGYVPNYGGGYYGGNGGGQVGNWFGGF